MKLKTGDVVRINIPNNIGHQQGGIRYGVIVSNNVGNKYSPTVEVLPSTTKRNGNQPTHAVFAAGEINGLPLETVFEAEAKWTINKFQIIELVTRLTESQMERIAKAMLYATPCIMAAINKEVYREENFQKVSNFY